MGVKHCMNIIRADAERRYAEAHANLRKAGFEAEIRSVMPDISTSDLPWQWHEHGLTDEQVGTIYVIGALRLRMDAAVKEGRHLAIDLDDHALMDDLERLNDEVNGGEGFEHYIIVAEGRQD